MSGASSARLTATRIRAELRAAGSGAPVAESRPARRHEWRGWLGALAGVAAALAVGVGWGQRHEGAQRLGQDLVTSHVIALTSGHLTDVASSDRHTVKPWLAEHLDFSPPVVDPAPAGFPLDGARVERVGGHLAGALIYHRARHVVTVFVWPEGQAPLPQLESERGYHARSWSQGGFNWVALSDVAFSDLDQFVGLVREGSPR